MKYDTNFSMETLKVSRKYFWSNDKWPGKKCPPWALVVQRFFVFHSRVPALNLHSIWPYGLAFLWDWFCQDKSSKWKSSIKQTPKMKSFKQSTFNNRPVQLIKVSPWDKVVSERFGVAHTLNTWIHKACVPQVTQTCSTFLCRNFRKNQEPFYFQNSFHNMFNY